LVVLDGHSFIAMEFLEGVTLKHDAVTAVTLKATIEDRVPHPAVFRVRVLAGVSSKPRPLGPSRLRIKEGGYRVACRIFESRRNRRAGPFEAQDNKPRPYKTKKGRAKARPYIFGRSEGRQQINRRTSILVRWR
jgi:hypothetical protein